MSKRKGDWAEQWESMRDDLKNGPVVSNKTSNNRGTWIIAKYHSTCSCGITINPGDDVWYIIDKKKVICTTCGHALYPPGLKQLLEKGLEAFRE